MSEIAEIDEFEYQRANGRIDRLEVEHFKSYKGHQQIGPFKTFTAIVGPNGSGKSNLMDAISFVLGVKTAQLRGSLKELLYSNSDHERPRRGYVKLVYVTEDDEEVQFSRVIQPSSAEATATYSSVYKINDKVVTWDAYSKKLAGFGILVKVRNFLVFQGDIEKVASRSREQLTQLFEQISGSDALAKPYEEAAAAKAKAEEQVQLLFAKKKSIAAERKQKKEQKEEAEKHMAAQEALRQRRIYYFLWQLYHLQQDESSAKQQQQVLSEELEDLNQQSAEYDHNLEQKRQQQSAIIRERMRVEKEQRKLQKKQEKKDPARARLHEEANRLTRRIAVSQNELDNIKRSAKAQAKKLSKLRKDLAQLKEARDQLESSGAGEDGQLQLDPAQLIEYRRLKAAADSKTSKLLQERAALEAQVKVDEGKLSRLQETSIAKTSRLQAQRAKLEELQQRLDNTQQAVDDTGTQLADKQRAAKNAAADHRKTSSQRDYLMGKVRDIEGRLLASKGMRQATDREKRLAAAAARLRKEVPGVYGRVSELVRVTNRKYNLAMAVVMQQHLDSVVVADRAAGFACVDFLKANKLERMDFIPLDSCEAKPLPERLRQLGGTATPALDLITFEPQYERACVHVCGTTLVVDTIEEARDLCYGEDHHKVVSVDGTLFKPNGTFTGGKSAGIDARANRWDAEEYEKLKQQREKIKKDIDALPDVFKAQTAAGQLQQEQHQLEQRIKIQKADAQQLQEQLDVLKASVATLESAAASAAEDPELAELQSAVSDKRKQLAKMDERVNDIKDRLFADFSKRVGVKNIRVYEETTLAAAAKLEAQKQQHEEQIVKVTEQIAYEEEHDFAKKLEDKQAQLYADTEKLEHLKEQEAQLDAAAEQVQDQAQQLAQKMEELRQQAESAAAGMKELQAQAAGYHKEVGRIKGQMAAATTALEAVRSSRRNLLEQATLDQVDLPYHGGADGGDEVNSGSDADNPMDVGEEAEGTQGTEDSRAKHRKAFDYSRLSNKDKAANTKKERETVGRRLKEELDATTAELATSAPNLKAVEQYEAVREKERQQILALDAARKEATAASKTFLHIQQKRTQRFNNAFEHIKSAIDHIYKQLTRSAIHPLGGQAYLSCDTEDEPYLGKVTYTAMPPTKRFRDMDQLSGSTKADSAPGGEKSVAALALLFAIHSYRPSPFFVLDEVDAALDATNVARVAHYIRSCTRPPGSRGARSVRGDADGSSKRQRLQLGQEEDTPGDELESFQSIVISLKDIFYEKADALVGVCRDLDQNCSKTITFDLSRFELPTEAS